MEHDSVYAAVERKDKTEKKGVEKRHNKVPAQLIPKRRLAAC